MNNKGWGLREMIFLSAIILFFVVLVSFLIGNLYNQLEMSGNNSQTDTRLTYTQIEENLKNASKQYYKKYKSEIGNIILSEDLIETGYIKKAKLSTSNDSCEGYVIIDEDFTPYIKCSNYETEGY